MQSGSSSDASGAGGSLVFGGSQLSSSLFCLRYSQYSPEVRCSSRKLSLFSIFSFISPDDCKDHLIASGKGYILSIEIRFGLL